MTSKVTLTQDGTTAALHVSAPGEEFQIEADRLNDIAKILESWLAADSAFEALSDETQEKRLRAYLAQDMKVQAALATLVEQSDLLCEIVSGNANIGDYGFPEFQDE